MVCDAHQMSSRQAYLLSWTRTVGPLFPPLPDVHRREAGIPGKQDADATRKKAIEMLSEKYWDAQTLDSIKVSTGFLDSQIHDMLWMQNRLLDHHENLIRTRNLIEKTNHALHRSQAMRARVSEVSGVLEDIALATAKDMEDVSRGSEQKSD